MPMLQVNLLSGYSSELKGRLCRALTSVIASTIQAKPEAISIWVNEVSPENYCRAGESRQPGQGSHNPETMVREYLTAMENRELTQARQYLSDDFVMTFPGSGDLTSLEQLVEWSRGRYRFVQKTISAVNVAYEMESAVVFVHGTLHGEWPDGTAFKDVRFIDRFEIRNDRLTRQDVWNDLANAQPQSNA
ncbi:tautomerase family protein [Marinobacter sp.]|uniref:tautomerase family protein n=1 Tax=Marinobacter sp. TaxID=50741 RepID=UPI0035678B95